MQRESRSLRLFTIESHFYSPPQHAAILFGAVTRLKASEGEAYGAATGQLPAAPFDLAVFPEVFLPAAGLLTLVRSLLNAGPTGCIHTGLRPDTGQQFLFTRDQALTLIDGLITAGAAPADLATFATWLRAQSGSSHFNLGAVAAVDAGGQVRVALHPKVLRSKFELSPFAESNMTEAKFLTLIKLVPTEPTLLPVVLQPLLCSDALIHDTDFPAARPLDAISRYGNSFATPIPDHVDLISLGTCSPHPNSVRTPLWHLDFREGFLRMSKDDANLRHRHAVLVMANFVEIPENTRTGGLSGAFLPIPLQLSKQPDYVVAAKYATAESAADPAWHYNDPSFSKQFAHMICLRPPEAKKGAMATMLGFDLHRMLKETNQYHAARGLLNYERLIGHVQADGTILFS